MSYSHRKTIFGGNPATHAWPQWPHFGHTAALWPSLKNRFVTRPVTHQQGSTIKVIIINAPHIVVDGTSFHYASVRFPFVQSRSSANYLFVLLEFFA